MSEITKRITIETGNKEIAAETRWDGDGSVTVTIQDCSITLNPKEAHALFSWLVGVVKKDVRV